MMFENAKREFEIRYYLWSISEFDKEIEELFPNLRSFKAGYAWEIYQFMQLLNRKEQLTLARSLLKRWHRNTAKILGENVSTEEEFLLSKCDGFFRIKEQYQIVQQLETNGQTEFARAAFQRCVRPFAVKIIDEPDFDNEKTIRTRLDTIYRDIPSAFDEQLAARKKAGEKIRFVSKRKLQKVIIEGFKNAFGDQCLDYGFDDLVDPSSHFEMRCCGWILTTHFWFGRRESLIDYSHTISSPARIKHPNNPEITGPAMLMGNQITWLCMNRWEYILGDEVEVACNEVIKFCGRFIEIAPKLLKGIEFKRITSE